MTKRTRTPINLSETARTLARHRDLWRRLVDFDPISRYYARIASSADYEAWLLTWLPGQGTDWHEHGSSAGSFVVLQGQLTEEVAGPVRPTHRLRRWPWLAKSVRCSSTSARSTSAGTTASCPSRCQWSATS